MVTVAIENMSECLSVVQQTCLDHFAKESSAIDCWRIGKQAEARASACSMKASMTNGQEAKHVHRTVSFMIYRIRVRLLNHAVFVYGKPLGIVFFVGYLVISLTRMYHSFTVLLRNSDNILALMSR